MTERSVTVVGAGLAGCEAAWQLAVRGVNVTLFDMKPGKKSPANNSGNFAELVCSNSLRGESLSNAVGLLKEELRRMDSLIISCADSSRVEAGGALAVDRDSFSELVTGRVKCHPLITVVEQEVDIIPEGYVIIATGPLTSDALAVSIREFFGGSEYLSFYDAAAPLVDFESIDMDKAFFASRYDKGTPDYVNCPMDAEQYISFVRELASAQEAHVHGFEDGNVFEGCMPVEVLARRGEDTLRHGPLKPVGLNDPATGKSPYAVVQLRKDNAAGTIYNIVGFQTHLKFPEQRRVFSMIPALHDAEFLRYGVMHRNTYIDSPRLLNADYTAKRDCRVAFAGQLTGVEGYVESAASGFLAGVSMAARLNGGRAVTLGKETAIGALASYVSDPTVRDFQPMNINFGIINPLDHRVRGKQNRNLEIAQRSLSIIDDMVLQDEPERRG